MVLITHKHIGNEIKNKRRVYTKTLPVSGDKQVTQKIQGMQQVLIHGYLIYFPDFMAASEMNILFE